MILDIRVTQVKVTKQLIKANVECDLQGFEKVFAVKFPPQAIAAKRHIHLRNSVSDFLGVDFEDPMENIGVLKSYRAKHMWVDHMLPWRKEFDIDTIIQVTMVCRLSSLRVCKSLCNKVTCSSNCTVTCSSNCTFIEYNFGFSSFNACTMAAKRYIQFEHLFWLTCLIRRNSFPWVSNGFSTYRNRALLLEVIRCCLNSASCIAMILPT
ncbi:hypothetical protein CUMW_264560 [Citrus unshiu]|uniref:Uncharacterized protein n=1 Tax=Citrus unshiu TaxID=55188 RepID=A0A2H5QV47_CITUN|nr:hypothetical protein CUMW_264560 [Citrus unshiu]